MKLIVSGDLHARATAPINRKDNFVEAWFRKFRQLIDKTNELGALLIIPGDFLDKPTVPTWLMNRILDEFERLKTQAVIIPGNHDSPGHQISNIRQSGLWTLHRAASPVQIYPTGAWTFLDLQKDDEKEVIIHTIPFGSEPSEPPTHGAFNVFVGHVPVFEGAVPFYMADEGLTTEQLESRYPGYDLYLVGDIHIPVREGKTLVPGSMMRSTIIQREFLPRFYEFDTETGTTVIHFFQIEPDVWKEHVEAKEDSEYKEELKALAEVMRGRAEKLDYRQVIAQIAKPNINTKIQEIADEYVEKA